MFLLHIKGYEWAFQEGLSERARGNLDQAVEYMKHLLAHPEIAIESQEELITFLQQNLHSDTSALIKGSRFMQMDKVVAAIVENKSKGSA